MISAYAGLYRRALAISAGCACRGAMFKDLWRLLTRLPLNPKFSETPRKKPARLLFQLLAIDLCQQLKVEIA